MWLKRLSPTFLLLLVISSFGQPVSRVQQLIDEGYYEEAGQLCDSVLRDPSQKADRAYYLSKLGDVHYFQGDLRASLKHYLLALEQPTINHPENRLLKEESTSYTGFVYRELGLGMKAEEYFRSALNQAFAIGDSVEIAVCYYNISTVLLTRGRLDESMDMLQKAYEIDLIRKDTSAIGFDLTMMGNAMLKTDQSEQAIRYYRESIRLLHRSAGNYNSLAKRYGLLAEAFVNTGQWDSASYYTQMAIESYAAQSDSVHIGVQWVKLAMIANASGDHNLGIHWAQKARFLFSKYPVSRNDILANTSLIEANLSQGQYQGALKLLAQNEQMSRELGLLYELRDTHLKMAEVYNLLNKYQPAYLQMQLSNVLTDSINKLETEKASERMRVRYDAEKIERENKVLELENKVTRAELAEREAAIRNLILVGSILLILGVAAISIIVIRSRYQTQLLQAQISELRTRIKGILEFKPEEAGIVKEQINDSLQETLSDREFEILNLALSNKNNNQIAEEIHLSVNTVKFHLKNIYSKLGVSNRKEALKFAVQVTSN